MRRGRLDIEIIDSGANVSTGWCVPFALSALMSAHGRPVSITEVILGVDFNPNVGLDDPQIFTILRLQGWRWKHTQLPDEVDWENLPYPIMLYYWAEGGEDPEGHMAVMLTIDKFDRAVLIDSIARGVRIIPVKKLWKLMNHPKIGSKDRRWVLWLTGRRKLR